MFSVLSAFQDYNEVLIPGNYLYLCGKLLVLCNHFSRNNLYEVLIPGKHLHFSAPNCPLFLVVDLDEVLIPSNHLHFLASSNELQFLVNHFLSVTSLDGVLVLGNHFCLLIPSDKFPV